MVGANLIQTHLATLGLSVSASLITPVNLALVVFSLYCIYSSGRVSVRFVIGAVGGVCMLCPELWAG